MYLFILESIGTWELVVIGIFALVLFGPRKLPEMARKMGSMLTEFKRVSNDFKSTWEDAVALEETKETKKIESDEYSDASYEIENTISQNDLQSETGETEKETALPEIREVSKEEFEDLIVEKKEEFSKKESIENDETTYTKPEKTNWL